MFFTYFHFVNYFLYLKINLCNISANPATATSIIIIPMISLWEMIFLKNLNCLKIMEANRKLNNSITFVCNSDCNLFNVVDCFACYAIVRKIV